MVKYLSTISAIQWKKRSSKAMRRDGHEIPFDLVIEILTRLPGKSLMRFRCVSKLWSCLIRSRYFSNLYFTVSSTRPQPLGLYMSLNSVNWVRHFKCDSMEHCLNPGKSDLLSLRLLSTSNSVESSLELNSTFPGMQGHMMVVLRGLILYTICRKACIYNPTTRQSLILPAVKSNIFAQQAPNKRVYYFFGHDPINDQYKILCNVVLSAKHRLTSEFWVFVVEPGGFWKRIEHDDQAHFPTRQGLCIKGVIYYLTFSNTCVDTLYSFDVRSEKLHKIQAPYGLPTFCVGVSCIQHGGKPALFRYINIREGVSELWVLEDGVTWSRKSLVVQPCQRHLVDDIDFIKVKVHGQNNEEVILALPNTCQLLYYDLIKNNLRKVNINRESLPDKMPNVNVKVMDKGESILHLGI